MAENKHQMSSSDVLQIIDSNMLFFSVGLKSKQTFQTTFQHNSAPTTTTLIKTEFL